MERIILFVELTKHVRNRNLVKHCLALEACLTALAQHFGEDKETWALAGLVHDIDYEYTLDKPEEHGLKGAQMLREMGVSDTIINAVLAHADKYPRDTRLNQAIFSADPLTGLIVAAALIKPEKKLAAIDTEFVLNRFKEKGFARGARREEIALCSELGLSLEEFVSICLAAMQGIAGEIGL